MRYAIRLILAVGVVVVLVAVAVPCVAQKSKSSAPINFSPLVENVKGGQIDWGAEMMYASGEGAMPPASQEPNRARAFLKAKEYAKMAAIANLLMLIEGTSISYSATGKDFMAQDVSLRQTIEGYVKNVNVVRTVQRKEEGETIVKVTVGTRIYGKDTPGQALLAKLSEIELTDPEPDPVKLEIKGQAPKVVEPQRMSMPTEVEESDSTSTEPSEATEPEPSSVEESKEPEPSKESEPVKETPITYAAVSQPSVKAEPHTSVIIDTLGYNVMRAMAPKIRAKNGDEVWGTFKMDPDEIQDHGTVAYARSLADAKKSPRAGSNPLILKAIGRAGGSRMCDVVLSDEDVAKLKECDQVSKPSFLATKKVIFVVDPTKAF
ncbi:MAG: hypothetical protein N3B12_00975 [Armatimonadetes bacterium]|nr:hypothetical protein [Armatimonadota bacterium]